MEFLMFELLMLIAGLQSSDPLEQERIVFRELCRAEVFFYMDKSQIKSLSQLIQEFETESTKHCEGE